MEVLATIGVLTLLLTPLNLASKFDWKKGCCTSDYPLISALLLAILEVAGQIF
jgi:hypothetical protein